MSKLSQTIKSFWDEPYFRFICYFLLLSLFLYEFNTAYIGITAKGGIYVPFLDQHLNYINWWRNFTIDSAATVLRWMDYIVYTNDYQLKVIGRHGFTMVYTCLGYGIMSVFSAFVITFPGYIKARYGFLLFGLVLIQLLNTLRLIVLSLYWDKRKPLLTIDHHDLFNIIVYVVLILLVYGWFKCASKRGKV